MIMLAKKYKIIFFFKSYKRLHLNFWKALPKNLIIKFDLLKNLNQQKVFKINKNYDYCFFREDDFNNKYFNFLEKINIKKFIVLERPFTTNASLKNFKFMYSNFTDPPTYFCDKMFISDNNGAKKTIATHPVIFFKPLEINIKKKDIDILYIFTNRKKQRYINNILINFYAKKNINNFGNLFEGYKKNFILSRNKIDNYSNYYLKIKYLRQNYIIQKLNLLSNNLRIAFVTHEKLPDLSKNIKFFKTNYGEKLLQLVKRSKINICTNPMALSCLNERLVFSLKYGSIPLVEPYKQFYFFNNDLKFRYNDTSFENKIYKILKNYKYYTLENKKIVSKLQIRNSLKKFINSLK